MDPWLDANVVEEDRDSSLSDGDNNVLMKFEDDFEPSYRLPDSLEYLATLEKKLARLKEGQSKKDLIHSLEEKHKSCMLRLVSAESSNAFSQEDLDLDMPVNINHPLHALMRRIAPECQAVTLGELVELLKRDQLAEVLTEEETNSDINPNN